MPKTLNTRISGLGSTIKGKDIIFSDVVLMSDGEWNAFVGWREGGAVRMSYGHGGSSAEESITRLEGDLVARYA